jgi:hypothetical protein
MSETFRRVATVLLALTFVVSLVPHGARAADAGAKMVIVAMSDMPMSGMCDGCGDDQKTMTAAACSALCASFVALPSIETMLEPPPVEAFDGFAGSLLTGHTVPPDPYPPRPVVLS